MANSTSICPDTLNLTFRPWDNLTLRKELERQCHIQLIVFTCSSFLQQGVYYLLPLGL